MENTKPLFDGDGNEIKGAVPVGIGEKILEDEAKKAEESRKKAENDKIIEENKKELENVRKQDNETVTINKKALDTLLQRMERLEQSADKSRLANYDDKNKKDLPTVIRLSVFDGKVIVGWKTIKDDVQKVNGIWREYQLIQLKFEDDTTHDLPYLQFIQEVVKVDATILSRTKESNGEETLKVQRITDGKEYLVDIRFIN